MPNIYHPRWRDDSMEFNDDVQQRIAEAPYGYYSGKSGRGGGGGG